MSRKMEGVNLVAGNSPWTRMSSLKHFHVGVRTIQHAIKQIAVDPFPGFQFQSNVPPVAESQFNDALQLLLGAGMENCPLKALRGRIFKPILRHKHRTVETGKKGIR